MWSTRRFSSINWAWAVSRCFLSRRICERRYVRRSLHKSNKLTQIQDTTSADLPIIVCATIALVIVLATNMVVEMRVSLF